MVRNYLIALIFTLNLSCGQERAPKESVTVAPMLTGAEQLEAYLPKLEGKRVGLCINHSAIVGDGHLLDTLMALGIEVKKVFTPEHGFTGVADAGEKVDYDENEQAFELISLYGSNRKPTDEQMADLDVVVYDIQDVGARFYTYISTMTYLMDACAKNDISFLVLDRPNPNGSYVDGPVLDTAYRSFVGLHPVPIVHGLTSGEFAKMINGEGWLSSGLSCELDVVTCKNWDHSMPYSLPLKPSPNLPDDQSIALYPSLCLFEQTMFSVGRGTERAFQQIGHPDYPDTSFYFIPESREGASSPLFEGQQCFGVDYAQEPIQYAFTVQPLIDLYAAMESEAFFKPYFHRLAGTKALQTQIEAGLSESEIRASWEPALTDFKNKRKKYLLYSED
ncbi:MAG: DUF1343 domain-containing protein [Cytophagales bacterium]|nr:DUF1343 domain-containing protein [Cytophagales bacterium]